jgi:hypothetical protein
MINFDCFFGEGCTYGIICDGAMDVKDFVYFFYARNSMNWKRWEVVRIFFKTEKRETNQTMKKKRIKSISRLFVILSERSMVPTSLSVVFPHRRSEPAICFFWKALEIRTFHAFQSHPFRNPCIPRPKSWISCPHGSIPYTRLSPSCRSRTAQSPFRTSDIPSTRTIRWIGRNAGSGRRHIAERTRDSCRRTPCTASFDIRDVHRNASSAVF